MRHQIKIRRALAAVLAFAVLAAAAAYMCPVVSWADEISELQDSIDQKKKEIEAAKGQKNELQSGLTDVKSVIAGLEKSKNDLAAYVSGLDATLSAAQAKINELTEMISEKETEITKTKAELEEAQKTEQQQYAAMKDRIKSMYERGDSFYFEIVFSARSFGDMLNRADYVERLTAADKRLLDKFKTTREYVETCKQQLEAEQELLGEAKSEAEEEQHSLELLIAEKEQQMAAYQADINSQEQVLKAYEDEMAARDAEIKALEKAMQEQQAALEKANNKKNTYDGGMFAWPAPSYTRISDDFGMREVHPIYKVQKMHNGVDMAAPGGSPILAAYDGTVIAAAYSSSMGNYIMIDHGDGLTTIYMHASALYVKSGQNVSKGEKIAAVGTTGNSTGNHLHFGVRLNGTYVNPWNYLK